MIRTSQPSRQSSPQRGFSLMELLVAMTIMAVIATLGFTQVKKQMAQAKYTQATGQLRLLSQGLDQYYLKPNKGGYPEFASIQAMIEPGSVLVKESLIPTNLKATDPWGNAYEGSSSKATYSLKCGGDPSDQENYPAFTYISGKGMETAPTGGDAPVGAPAAEGAPK